MTALFGLIGEKLGHSLSPVIHKKFFSMTNMDADFKLFEIDPSKLETDFISIKSSGIKGLNVTIPYKIDIMNLIDEISPQAAAIGSINTICFNDSKTVAHNTDYFGFGKMLAKNDIPLENKTVVILGAGGSANAVIEYAINSRASKIFLVSRTPAIARKKFNSVPVIDYNELNNLSSGDVIVNCTPVGMFPTVAASPVNSLCLSKFSSAVDLIYNPIETNFLSMARKQGLKTVNGLYMLVAQAICSEELWNNIRVDESIIDKIYKELTLKG